MSSWKPVYSVDQSPKRLSPMKSQFGVDQAQSHEKSVHWMSSKLLHNTGSWRRRRILLEALEVKNSSIQHWGLRVRNENKEMWYLLHTWFCIMRCLPITHFSWQHASICSIIIYLPPPLNTLKNRDHSIIISVTLGNGQGFCTSQELNNVYQRTRQMSKRTRK